MMMLILLVILMIFDVNNAFKASVTNNRNRIKKLYLIPEDEPTLEEFSKNPGRAEELQKQIQAKIDEDEASGKNEFLNFLKEQYNNLAKQSNRNNEDNNDKVDYTTFIAWKSNMGCWLTNEEISDIWKECAGDSQNIDYEQFKEINRKIDEME